MLNVSFAIFLLASWQQITLCITSCLYELASLVNHQGVFFDMDGRKQFLEPIYS